MSTHYQTLGVAPEASLSDIRRAYYSLVAVVHPDKTYYLPDAERAERTEFFKVASAAWEVLRDEQNRLVYDRTLRESELLSQQVPMRRAQTYNGPQSQSHAPPMSRSRTTRNEREHPSHPICPMDEFANSSGRKFNLKKVPQYEGGPWFIYEFKTSLKETTVHYRTSWGWDVMIEVSNMWKLQARGQIPERDDDITKGFYMWIPIEKGSKWKSVFGKGKGKGGEEEGVKLTVLKAPPPYRLSSVEQSCKVHRKCSETSLDVNTSIHVTLKIP
jgi:hypothetical protein